MLDTRRDFLKKAAMLAGAAGLSSILPPSIQNALAINPAPGSTWMDAEHVVFLMQENRSFDHCFGTLKGVRGYNDPRAIDLPNGNPVWLQTNQKGETFAPFHLDIKNTKATWMSSLPHSWADQVDARNDGKFDQWLMEKQSGNKDYRDMPLTLGYYNRADIPFNYALADAFTVCDQHFCSSLTGTTPNRLFFWSGTVRSEQNENARACVWNEDADFDSLDWKTYPERLEENGISWKCYQNELSIPVGFEGEEESWLANYTDNPLEFFKQYHVKLHDKHVDHRKKRLAELPAKITETAAKISSLPADDKALKGRKRQLKDLQNELADLQNNPELLETDAFEKLTQQEKNIHLKALSTNRNDPHYHDLTTLTYNDNGTERSVKLPKGDPLSQFRQDVKTGKLPTVSWLVPPENFSDHPSVPWYGAWYVSEVMDILTGNPEVWKKTIFVLTYDENDGYFDHIPPFTAPHPHKVGTGKVSGGIDTSAEFVTREQQQARKGSPTDYERESAIGLGYRVPMIIASPWSRGGWVNSEVFDHTSSLQFLEKFLKHKTGKAVKEENISDWRRTVCGDLTSAFRPYNGDQISHPVSLQKDAHVENIHKAKFKKLPAYSTLSKIDVEAIKSNRHATPHMPLQEKGIKPSNALPYDLFADGRLSDDRKTFRMRFEAGTAAGAPLNVYAPGKYKSLKEPQQMETARNWAYAVAKETSLEDEWPLADFENNQYHLRTYGPNGFYREFKGNAQDPAAGIKVWHQQLEGAIAYTGNLMVSIDNHDNKPSSIEITDNAYHAKKIIRVINKGHTDILLDLQKNHNWYDFSVKIVGYPAFEKRYAGRVETGKPSFTDPLMGGMIG